MQQVLVAVLVVLTLLQPVRPQEGAQETEDNHSTNSELRVLYACTEILKFKSCIPLYYMCTPVLYGLVFNMHSHSLRSSFAIFHILLFYVYNEKRSN